MRKLLLLIVGLLSTGVFAFAAEKENDPPADANAAGISDRSLLKDQLFVVETDDESAADSLNRVSGNIDLGFAAPENAFKSEDQTKAGPFARAEAQDHPKEPHRY